jgi:hypothetical protein
MRTIILTGGFSFAYLGTSLCLCCRGKYFSSLVYNVGRLRSFFQPHFAWRLRGPERCQHGFHEGSTHLSLCIMTGPARRSLHPSREQASALPSYRDQPCEILTVLSKVEGEVSSTRRTARRRREVAPAEDATFLGEVGTSDHKIRSLKKKC